MRKQGLDHAPPCVTAEFKVVLKRPTPLGPIHVDAHVVSAGDDRGDDDGRRQGHRARQRHVHRREAGPPGVSPLVVGRGPRRRPHRPVGTAAGRWTQPAVA